MNSTKRQVARWVLRFRKAHGLTQRALAVELDVERKTVWNMENGRHAPKPDTLFRLANLERAYRQGQRCEH